jgi:hypothetical protein
MRYADNREKGWAELIGRLSIPSRELTFPLVEYKDVAAGARIRVEDHRSRAAGTEQLSAQNFQKLNLDEAS